jgi:hypothetical protein
MLMHCMCICPPTPAAACNPRKVYILCPVKKKAAPALRLFPSYFISMYVYIVSYVCVCTLQQTKKRCACMECGRVQWCSRESRCCASRGLLVSARSNTLSLHFTTPDLLTLLYTYWCLPGLTPSHCTLLDLILRTARLELPFTTHDIVATNSSLAVPPPLFFFSDWRPPSYS